MFGIGIGEFAIILLVLLLAVGPKSMPKLLQTVGKGMREFRKATRELRAQVGLDEMLAEVRKEVDIRDPLGIREMKLAGKDVSGVQAKGLTAMDVELEQPYEGVDLKHARDESIRRQKETLTLREQVGATGSGQREAEQRAALAAEAEAAALEAPVSIRALSTQGASPGSGERAASADAPAKDDVTPDAAP